jgi:Cdc6-like AAA superfamily ATPase
VSDLIPGLLNDGPKHPATERDWFELDVYITNIFSPHAPVDEQDLFSGRSDLLLRMIDIIYQKGLHAILYGERGVGKTSLTYILKDKLFQNSVQTRMVRRQCTADHDFELIWRHVFDEFTLDGQSADKAIPANPNAYDIIKLFEAFPKDWRPVIIIDEFDRVKDPDTYVKMADTIKYLADTASPVTLIIVGVAASVAELFGGHGSVHRNLQQIRMPTMSETELEKILLDRAKLAGITIGESVRDEIVKYSQGLPGYTHLLGQSAFRSAVRRKSLAVEMPDLGVAMHRCVDECDESVREAYAEAVRSTQTSSLYKEALLACALAGTDEKGYFRASAIKVPFSTIVGRDMDVFNFAQHLKQFCKPERGPALVRVGKKGSTEYRFDDALLRPYVIIKGKADGLI